MKTMIRDMLFEPIQIQLNGKTTNVTAFEGTPLKIDKRALEGDFRSAVQVVQLAAYSLDPDAGSEKLRSSRPMPLDRQTIDRDPARLPRAQCDRTRADGANGAVRRQREERE